MCFGAHDGLRGICPFLVHRFIVWCHVHTCVQRVCACVGLFLGLISSAEFRNSCSSGREREQTRAKESEQEGKSKGRGEEINERSTRLNVLQERAVLV